MPDFSTSKDKGSGKQPDYKPSDSEQAAQVKAMKETQNEAVEAVMPQEVKKEIVPAEVSSEKDFSPAKAQEPKEAGKRVMRSRWKRPAAKQAAKTEAAPVAPAIGEVEVKAKPVTKKLPAKKAESAEEVKPVSREAKAEEPVRGFETLRERNPSRRPRRDEGEAQAPRRRSESSEPRERRSHRSHEGDAAKKAPAKQKASSKAKKGSLIGRFFSWLFGSSSDKQKPAGHSRRSSGSSRPRGPGGQRRRPGGGQRRRNSGGRSRSGGSGRPRQS